MHHKEDAREVNKNQVMGGKIQKHKDKHNWSSEKERKAAIHRRNIGKPFSKGFFKK